MPLNTVIDWITDPNACFLLGAGCSKCAGKPLISDLTDMVEKDISDDTKLLLTGLSGSGGRKATVEDLVNQLQYLEKMLTGRTTKKDGVWTPPLIQDAISTIQKSIVTHVGPIWKSYEVHKRFLRRLTLQDSRRACDLFTLNYDTIIEASSEELKFPYTDGFWGGETAHFDEGLFERDGADGLLFRLYRLHGSINWIRDKEGTVRRHPCAPMTVGERVVIYPAEQKYYLTQYGVYELLLNRFRQRLRSARPNNKLIVLGYSFNDEHINEAILDSMCTGGNNLTLYAFIGPDADTAEQVARLRKLAARCRERFNAIVGQTEFIGSAISPSEWNILKPHELWKFENFVQALTGGLV